MKQLALALALAATLGAAQARDPFTSAQAFRPADKAEELAWQVGEAVYDDATKRRAITNDFRPLEAYLQQVLDKVYPEFVGKFRVRVMPDLGVNAMALPDGSVYVGGGILLRMTNEAQLAALLGHEAAHVTHRHGVEAVEGAQSTGGAIVVLNLTLAMVPLPVTSMTSLVANPVARMAAQWGVGFTLTSSIYGFSRAREQDADEIGITRMAAAGYDPREAAVLFRHLADEAALSLVSQPFFFASHPAMESRVASFQTLAAGYPAGGRVGADAFDQAVRPYRTRLVRREFAGAQMRGLVAYFDRQDVPSMYGPGEAAYLQGEALRKFGLPDELPKAPSAYRKALKEGYAADQVMEPLILVHLRMKQPALAKAAIAEWVAAGKPADALDVKEYLAQASKLENN